MLTESEREGKDTSMIKEALIVTLIFTAIIALLVFYTSENKSTSTIKPCQHWIFTYYYRGRMNNDVICADTLYINDRGQYKALPPHLKRMQDDITQQYQFLIQRMSLVDRQDLRAIEEAN